jgi:HK97 gp10 family phage protein
MKIGVRIRGDRELRNRMRNLGSVTKADANALVRSALEPMRDLTEANAMVLRQAGTNPRGGHLDQGVVVVPVAEKSSRTRTTWWVSFTKRARKIAHLVEFGTAPHAQPRRGIMHPGARPKPFFRPAFDASKGGVFKLLGAGIERMIMRKMR